MSKAAIAGDSSVRHAVRRFVQSVPPGTTVSLNSGGREVTIVGGLGVSATADVASETQPAPKGTDKKPETGGIAAERLRSLVERIERLHEERKALSNDIADIYQEAKSAGFDVKVLRQLIKIRQQEPADVEEQETLLDVYRRALGM